MDRSQYYKGLMLLIRKDREIHEEEKRIMMAIGETLSFDADFCVFRIQPLPDASLRMVSGCPSLTTKRMKRSLPG